MISKEFEKNKLIEKHYDNEVKKHGASAKCTMIDTSTRNLEIFKIEEVIRNLLGNNPVHILEIGCGNGYTLSKISKIFSCKFTGIDSNMNMIKVASKRKLKNVVFKVEDILNTKIKNESFDIIYSERCLINLLTWDMQKKALLQIHRLLRKGGHYIMLEAFEDGLMELNQARKAVGLEKIPPAIHNYYFKKNKFEFFIKNKFVGNNNQSKIDYDNFLSSYYFGSRVLYPALIRGRTSITYNNKFVKYFSLIPSIGNYSQLKLCILKKI